MVSQHGKKKSPAGGRSIFKAKNYKNALKNYSRVFGYTGLNTSINLNAMFTGADPPTKRSKSDGNEPNLEDQLSKLRITTFSNIAACYLKMENYEKCIEKCNRVLECDADNVKAIFRRGRAYLALKDDFNAAKDLEKAQQAMPDDKLVQYFMKKLKKMQKKQSKSYDKAMARAMKAQLRVSSSAASKKENTVQNVKPSKEPETPQQIKSSGGDVDGKAVAYAMAKYNLL